MKKTLAILLCLVMLLSAMGAAAFAEGYTPGVYSASAEGMGTVTVTLTVDENGITAVELDTSGETATIGGAHDEEFIAQILAQGAEIDGISGASITSHAIRIAVEKALAQAAGVEASGEKTPVADGTYTAKTPSFGVMKEMELAVTFENNAITKIETICAGSATQADEDEYNTIYATVENFLFPRIIDAQSLGVDNISGATTSSNAAKTIIGKIILCHIGCKYYRLCCKEIIFLHPLLFIHHIERVMCHCWWHSHIETSLKDG